MATSPQTFSPQTFSDLSGGVSDIFGGIGDQYKAEGAAFEQQSYEEAATFAGQNAEFAAESTKIKQGQADRELYTSVGRTTAAVGNAGFAGSGSALDILRSSAQEGATTRAVLGKQGLIQEAGYEEQQQSYTNLANAAGVAEQADKTAEIGSFIGAGIQAVAGIASIALAPVTGGASLALGAAALTGTGALY